MELTGEAFVERAMPPAASVAPEEPKTGFVFTVQNTRSGVAPPAPIRRGRGTFSHCLHTEELERQPLSKAPSSVLTGVTTSVVLPPSQLSKAFGTEAEEDDLSVPNAFLKRDIPMNMPTPLLTATSFDRDHFFGDALGRVEALQAADTVRQLLFRGEKRRRYCVIVGNLQNEKKEVTLKLFGHRGNKPFKLQNKLIRLINLSIGRPRLRQGEDGVHGEGEEAGMAAQEGKHMSQSSDSVLEENAVEDAEKVGEDSANHTRSEADPEAAAVDFEGPNVDAEEKVHKCDTATDVKDQDEHSRLSDSAESAEAFVVQRRPSDRTFDEINARHVEAGFPGVGEDVRPSMDVDDGCQSAPGGGEDSFKAGGSGRQNSVSRGFNNVNKTSGVYHHDDASEHGDVDHYFDGRDDEVVPLMVERGNGDQAHDTAISHEAGLANSPVLTSKYFATLKDYFLREFRFLLSLEDVKPQNVSVNIHLGSAYCCLARHGSHATPLKHASFIQFVERMNDESMQLYFIKDCPTCVSRAVDMECGALHHEISLTMVMINFFSNERQSRMTARATWDSESNAFRLLDMEGMGVFFNWTIFSLDESDTEAPKDRHARRGSQPNGANSTFYPLSEVSSGKDPTAHEGSSAGNDTAPTQTGEVRKKTVAYPFEVEFRAFRRWKQKTQHPATELANAILDKLSLAEHNLINYGSSVGYERMDLSHVCEVDYAAEDYNVESIVVEHTSRVKPVGTKLYIDNTTALFIENFAAARQLKEQITQYGPERVAAMQKPSNNNFMRGDSTPALGGRRAHRQLLLGATRRPGRGGISKLPDYMEEVLCPSSKLTFFRSRGSTVHWKFLPSRSVEENLAPLAEAMTFVQQVLKTANKIERSALRGGAAPEAL